MGESKKRASQSSILSSQSVEFLAGRDVNPLDREGFFLLREENLEKILDQSYPRKKRSLDYQPLPSNRLSSAAKAAAAANPPPCCLSYLPR